MKNLVVYLFKNMFMGIWEINNLTVFTYFSNLVSHGGGGNLGETFILKKMFKGSWHTYNLIYIYMYMYSYFLLGWGRMTKFQGILKGTQIKIVLHFDQFEENGCTSRVWNSYVMRSACETLFPQMEYFCSSHNSLLRVLWDTGFWFPWINGNVAFWPKI